MKRAVLAIAAIAAASAFADKVYLKSGFANEISFFRTFKGITGMTPSEWKAKELANEKGDAI